ncbi:MAG: DUF4136 domain-containing protein [Planctomycetota bacterium]
MPTSRILAAALSLTALACTSIDVNEPKTEDIMASAGAASDASFEGKTTYAWGGNVTEILDSTGAWKAPDTDDVAAIQRAVDAELASHGMTKTEEGADVLAYYGVGANLASLDLIEGQDFQTSSIDPMAKVGMGVVLVDAATSKRIWAGIATGDIDWTPTDEGTSQRIEYAAKKLFKDFPN